MKKIIDNFLAQVQERNQNEPEFMQAVTEVAENVIPYILKMTFIMGKIFYCVWLNQNV